MRHSRKRVGCNQLVIKKTQDEQLQESAYRRINKHR
jgi:hypothetical protein